MLSKSIYVSARSTFVCSVTHCIHIYLSIAIPYHTYMQFVRGYSRSVAVCLCAHQKCQTMGKMNERNERQPANQPLTMFVVNQSYVLWIACCESEQRIFCLHQQHVSVCQPYGIRHFKQPMKTALTDSANSEYANQLIFVYQLFCMRHRIASIFSHVCIYFAVNIIFMTFMKLAAI